MPIAQDNRPLIQRLSWLRAGMLLVFLGLGLKVWFLTIIRADHYRDLALQNQIRTLPLVAPRGLIFDREGRVLVENAMALHLFLYPDEVDDWEDTRRFLSKELLLDPEFLDQRREEGRAYSRYQPILIKEDLSMEEISRILSHQAEHPELGTIEQPRRLYRYGDLGAHVFGYVGEVSAQELERPEFVAASPGDVVGKAGVERTFNQRLTGSDGYLRVLVNSAGKRLAELEREFPQPGQDLRLTLDLDLQMVAESELSEHPGAVFAFDPRTGDVLALASRPSFDPNLFATRITSRQWRDLMENEDHPFQNRVTQATFSPGSIFKVVMALAGLELGVIDESTSVYCPGGVNLYGHWFRCWKAGGHGRVRLQEALQHSCNVYFYLLGQKMGIDAISEFSHRVGLGMPTGIELLSESSGLVPSSEWKRRAMGQPWYAGETISVAIGQGALTVTPAQLARGVGVVATGLTPQLSLIADPERAPAAPTGFESGHLSAIRTSMWKVVNEWGTGTAARVAGFDVCGKTGTAQTISREGLDKLTEEQRARFEPNAWFVGYAPREAPEIVVAVIVQRGGSGGSRAGPIAGRILETYHRKHRNAPETMNLAAN